MQSWDFDMRGSEVSNVYLAWLCRAAFGSSLLLNHQRSCLISGVLVLLAILLQQRVFLGCIRPRQETCHVRIAPIEGSLAMHHPSPGDMRHATKFTAFDRWWYCLVLRAGVSCSCVVTAEARISLIARMGNWGRSVTNEILYF